jgi:hypothetical protein
MVADDDCMRIPSKTPRKKALEERRGELRREAVENTLEAEFGDVMPDVTALKQVMDYVHYWLSLYCWYNLVIFCISQF